MRKDFPYSKRYEPPAPVIEVTIFTGYGEAQIDVLIDSGADVSMLPAELLQSINARFIEKHRAVPLFGRPYTVDLYAVNMRVGGYEIHAVEVIALKGNDEPLIGRNVLNHLIVTLDGIGGITEVS